MENENVSWGKAPGHVFNKNSEIYIYNQKKKVYVLKELESK